MLRRIALSLALPLLAMAAVTYSYDDAGRLTKVDYGDGRTITYTYDPTGNLLSRTTTAAGGASSVDKSPKPAAKRDPEKPRAAESSPRSTK
jgi:YD repeat-containing protein